MIRYLSLAALALVLTGCDAIRAGLSSRTENVNAAFPLPEELITAQNILLGSVGDAKSGNSPLQAQYAQLLDVRALSCSSAAALSRFDTPAQIRAKITDSSCFREQDAKLIDWVGMQRLILALQKPALVPFAPLPARTVVATPVESASAVIIAADANVLVLKGNSQSKLTAIELPSGKTINAFAGPEQTYRPGQLSPNGRVLAMPAGNAALKFLDVESGSTLWSTDKYSDVTAWLPAIGATLLAQKGNSAPMLLDHRNATFQPYAVSITRLTWAVPFNAAEGSYLVGNNSNAALVEHARGTDGSIKVNAARQWRLSPTLTSAVPLLMANGKKLVYAASQDLAWLDLEGGVQGTWNVGVIGGQGFSKISESGIYFDMVVSTSPYTRGARLFDIEQGTVAAIQGGESAEGQLMPLVARQGYSRRSVASVVIGGSAVAEGEAQPIDKLISEASLARQLAKLNGEAQQALQAVLNWQSAAVATDRRAATGIPPDAQVSAIGVYEAAGGRAKPGIQRQMPIDVTVAPGKIPLVLALSSYEAVQWRIKNNGRPIAAVLLAGYHQSTVTGYQGNVIVIGQQSAHKMDSPAYFALKAAIARYTPNPVRLFQGTYSGLAFTVPAN